MTLPLVTAVIPAHNGEAFLAEAIASCLAQDYGSLEVLVVDDGSTDRTAEIACAFPDVRLLRGEAPTGAAASRNRAVAAARSDFVAFLDQDDLWEPAKTRRQMDALAADPHADGVLAHVRQFFTPGREAELARRFRLPDRDQPGYLPSALLIRKASFERAGGFPAGWRISEGLAFFVRAWETGLRLPMLPETLVRRRIHGGNTGIRLNAHRDELPRLLKATLDAARRRRPTSGDAGGS